MHYRQKAMYTPSQYAKLKGVVRRTVYNWIYSKKIDYQKLPMGGYIIFEEHHNEANKATDKTT